MVEFTFHSAGVTYVPGSLSKAFDNTSFGSRMVIRSEVQVAILVGWLFLHGRCKTAVLPLNQER